MSHEFSESEKKIRIGLGVGEVIGGRFHLPNDSLTKETDCRVVGLCSGQRAAGSGQRGTRQLNADDFFSLFQSNTSGKSNEEARLLLLSKGRKDTCQCQNKSCHRRSGSRPSLNTINTRMEATEITETKIKTVKRRAK